MAKIDLNDYLEKLTEPEDRETVANRAYQRELFEQYVTKDGNFPEQRAQLLEDFRVGKELTGPKGLRRKLGAFDLEYFGRAYLAHYFVRPSPKFHGELDRIWREGVLKGMNPEVDAKRISRADGCRRAIEAPRGHAKSTTFTFKDDLHAAVYGYKHYIIILSDSSEQAEGFLVDIKTELEENAALKEDFGELEGKVWKSSVILLANGVKIEAIGSGKKIRGRRHKQWRPDLIVCDDLENDENVNTPEQRKKLRDWFYKAVSKAGDTYTDIVYIGTLLHFDALLANVAKNPSYKSVRYQGVISFATNGELWDAWESIFTDLSNDNRQEDALEFFQANREAMLEGTAVLWEEKLSYSDLSDMEFGEMFSAGISDAVRAFKTSGSGMAQAIQNLGASATTAQVPLEEQLSVLGMLQATMGGAEAGTKYKAFLRSATKGGEALGLKFTDANNQLLSMPEILDILRGKFGETMDAAEKMELQKAFGDTEAVALIDLMYNKVGDLQDNIVNMYGSLGKGVSVTEQMASAIQETEPERFERLKQRIHNVTESIGNSLLPTVNDLMSKGEGVLTKVGSWIEKNQELVKVIMLIVLAVGGFLAVGGTLIALISGVGLVVTKTVSAFKILKGGFALARGALTPLISSVWSFTAALLANPVTWVVIGIVALIAALVLLYNKCEWFRNAVNSVINFFKETLTAVGSVAKSVFEGIGNVIGSVMDAAKATVSEKLSNIKTAYEEHGGGISGVAAAAMEAVKGWYTAGYTFIDNLTGGKLSEIRGKFSTAMSNIVQGISQKFTDARTAFSNGLNNIKNAVSGAVTWFFESGKRIVSTFANGIKSAFSSAVEAVKGGLQKIRNLLPFSDAKEGPLSTLTLSGQRTMTTYAHGLTLAGDAPAEAMNKSLQQVQGALDRKPEKKVDLGGGKKDKDESSDEGGSGKGKQVIIHKLLVPVDLKKIKDLQQLLALLQEVEDYAAANEDGEPGDDEDAVPAPA